MKIFIKLILLVVVVGFALMNYRYLSFDKGFSKTSMNDMSVVDVLKTVTGVKKVEYYKDPFNSKLYNVYIVTNEDAFLLKGTQDDIDAFSVLGIFSKSLKPEQIKPIPFYVEIIVGFVILVIPFGRRKSKKLKNAED